MADRTAEEALRSYGFDGDRLLKLCHRIAQDELRRRCAFLSRDRYEDLVGFLAMHGAQASLRFDPERHHARYGANGGSDHFSSWLADILSHRIVDWYRRKSEGNGDARYGFHNRIVLSDEVVDEPDDAFEHELALERTETGADLAEAIDELGRDLSPDAVWALREVAGRVAEGANQHQAVREAAASVENEHPFGEARRRFELLRTELAESRVSPVSHETSVGGRR